MPKSDMCSLCKRPNEEHRKPFCDVCGNPHEHHQDGEYDRELEAVARFARVRQEIGFDLVGVTDLDGKTLFKRVPVEFSDVQRKALKRFPDPHMGVLGMRWSEVG